MREAVVDVGEFELGIASIRVEDPRSSSEVPERPRKNEIRLTSTDLSFTSKCNAVILAVVVVGK